MYQGTVRAYLRIVEVDNAGVFIDPQEKGFYAREGVTVLAGREDT